MVERARRITVVGLSMVLAACGPSSRAPAPAPTTPAADGYAAKVAALSDKQRAGVMLRAIRDAGQDCQRVVEVSAAPGAAHPAWVATCDDKHRWVVVIGDDGTATVVDAKDVAARQ